MGLKNGLRRVAHVVSYSVWLMGQIAKESTEMAMDTFTTGRNIAPVIIYYPIRLTRERDIGILLASLNMTPGFVALGVTGPKEVDEDAAQGKRDLDDVASVASSEFKTHGLTRVQRFLAVHAMYGADPQEILHNIAVFESKVAPTMRKRKAEFDVEHLVERGVPGPRGYRGNRGGRASDDGIFDVEKVDSTPHAAAFVAAIMRQEDSLDENTFKDLSREEREKIVREHARKASEEQQRRVSQADDDDFTAPELDLDDGTTRTTGDDASDNGDGGVAALAEGAHGTQATSNSERGKKSGKRTSPIASLVHALEVRSRLPHPTLNLSSGTGNPLTDRSQRTSSATAVPDPHPDRGAPADGESQKKEQPTETDRTDRKEEDQ